MGARRTGPLIALLILGTAALIARLYQIQVVEHGIWAEEARRLVRSGALLPYRRGAILDGADRPLAEDTTRYRVELSYRDFRREHPLGQVAHGRAALEMRDVSLPEARARLVPWARELVQLSPRGLAAFARGGPLVVAGVDRGADGVQRGARAADLRFYAQGLMRPSLAERRRLRGIERDREGARSYLDLFAEWRGQTPETLLRELEGQWLASIEQLEFLALRLEGQTGGLAGGPGGALDRLVAELEDWRVSVDDSAASRLVREVFGFPAGRVAPDLWRSHIDLGWLAVQMRWDGARLEQWLAAERAGLLDSWRDGYALPRLLAELRLTEQRAREGDGRTRLDADRVLSAFLALYSEPEEFAAALDGRPLDWRRSRPRVVLDQLPQVLDVKAPRGWRPAELPLLLEGETLRARAAGLAGEARWELLELAGGVRAAERVEAALVAEVGEDGWRRHFGGNVAGLWRVALGGPTRWRAANRERVDLAARVLLDALEEDFQARLAERLLELSALAGGGADRPRLALAPDRIDRLTERARHLVKDFGSRRAVLLEGPSYEVVYLLTREPSRYPGFEVRTARERQAHLLEGEHALPAAELVGLVAGVDAERLQRQRREAAEFRELRQMSRRTEEQTRRLRQLMGELLLADEQRGVSGIEVFADLYLRGRHGFRERLGLEDVHGRGAYAVQLSATVDGQDVVLTLDRELQRAAERVLNRPRFPAGDPDVDRDWQRHPVGALVLLDGRGDVLAAASAPNASYPPGANAEGQALLAVERTLRQPTFQPVGSVFKPFVALHTLTHHASRGLHAGFVHVCEPGPDGSHAEWGGVRCHSRWGHGPVDLTAALEVSCNSYFARLADFLGPEEMRSLAEAVGFGLPTGVADLERGLGGLETVPRILEFTPGVPLDRQMRRAANGLQVLEGTPMQVARATLALARGERLPLRLVRSVGGVELPRRAPEPLVLAPGALASVHAGLWAVTNGRSGSARRSLSLERVGYAVAAKTGSADLVARRAADGSEGDGRRPKHTWIAGWLPAEAPELIFVVFVHETVATASHSAAHLAADLLASPEIERYLAQRGVRRAAVVGGEGNGR